MVEIDGVGPHSTHEALVKDAPRQNRLLATDRIVLLRFKPRDNDQPGGIGAVVAARIAELGGLSRTQRHPDRQRHHSPPAAPIPL